MAQTRITGNVTDEKGEPVIGASILVKGTDQGTVTDMEGNFSLSVLTNAKLVISYIGMKTQEVLATPNLRIVLQSDTELLDEVVVTAMGKSFGVCRARCKERGVIEKQSPEFDQFSGRKDCRSQYYTKLRIGRCRCANCASGRNLARKRQSTVICGRRGHL